MSNIEIKDSAKFEQIIDNFSDGIANIEIAFEKQNGNFNIIETTDIWEGDLQEDVSLKYRKLSDGYESVINSLRTLNEFMISTLNTYKQFEELSLKNQEENSNDLNVNS